MPDLHDDIRAALEAATPGPWTSHVQSYETEDGEPDGGPVARVIAEHDPMHGGPATLVHLCSPANAHLIAHAPEWLRALLDENEAQTREIEALRRKINIGDEAIEYALDEVKSWRNEAETQTAMRRDAEESGDLARGLLPTEPELHALDMCVKRMSIKAPELARWKYKAADWLSRLDAARTGKAGG